MNNNKSDFSSNTFTWVLEEQSSVTPQPPVNKQREPFGLSDSELFQFLLGDAAQRAVETENKACSSKPYNMEEDSSGSDDGPSSSFKEQYAGRQKSQAPNTASSTSRLDFRPINDFIPESQLKNMTSKERRQLRNKISARNFRNRRKEYIGTLEEELNQQKAENSQLKLELKWVKSQMDKLQKENDKLRLDLVLGGMVLPMSQPQPQQIQQTSPYLLDSSTTMNSTVNLTNSASSSSDESNLSSPPNLFTDFPDNWDFVLPQQQEQQRDTYLAHTTVPNWNIDQVLSKETSVVPATDSQLLFKQYPLLAPALMSIVLTHTMTMSTDEILATAKLNPPEYNGAMVPYNNTRSTGMTNKEAQAVWDILEPLTYLSERNAKISAATITSGTAEEEEDKDDGLKTDKKPAKSKYCEAYRTLVSPYCPITWLQQRVCRYLCEYAANHYENKTEKKFGLCKQFEKAKKYISACQ